MLLYRWCRLRYYLIMKKSANWNNEDLFLWLQISLSLLSDRRPQDMISFLSMIFSFVYEVSVEVSMHEMVGIKSSLCIGNRHESAIIKQDAHIISTISHSDTTILPLRSFSLFDIARHLPPSAKFRDNARLFGRRSVVGLWSAISLSPVCAFARSTTTPASSHLPQNHSGR